VAKYHISYDTLGIGPDLLVEIPAVAFFEQDLGGVLGKHGGRPQEYEAAKKQSQQLKKPDHQPEFLQRYFISAEDSYSRLLHISRKPKYRPV